MTNKELKKALEVKRQEADNYLKAAQDFAGYETDEASAKNYEIEINVHTAVIDVLDEILEML